jgi:hypothetical protein
LLLRCYCHRVRNFEKSFNFQPHLRLSASCGSDPTHAWTKQMADTTTTSFIFPAKRGSSILHDRVDISVGFCRFLTTWVFPLHRDELGPPGMSLAPRDELGSQRWAWPPGMNLAPRVNLAPRDELCALGEMFTPSFAPRAEYSQSTGYIKEWRGEERIFTLGANFTPGDTVQPLGPTTPLGVKVRP